MISSFNILTPGAHTAQCNLWIEVSCHSLAYIAIDGGNNCVALAVYHFNTGTSNDSVANNVKDIATSQPFLQQPFKNIQFIYAFAEALLVPHQYMNAAVQKDMLELVYGDTTDSIIHTDFMYRHNLHNVYRVPRQIDSVIANLFAQAGHIHQYSLLPDVVVASGNLLYCIFGTTHITVQLFKLGKLQAIQNFGFKVPEDAAYHLLNICGRFEVPVSETIIYLNGMIEEDSALYRELYKYFLYPVFSSLPAAFTYNEEIKKYPEHYFSHLFQLAACE